MTTPKTWLEAYAPGPVVRRNASYTVPASNGQIVAVTTLSAACTITLPAVPVLGQIVAVKRTGVFDYAITVDANGSDIDGAATVSVDDDYGVIYIAYVGVRWVLLATSGTSTVSETFQIGAAADGPTLKNDAGALAVRDEADAAYESVIAASYELSATGPILKQVGTSLSVRNAADDAPETVIAKTVELTEGSAVEMRVGATGRGDGLTIVHQASGSDVWYGWNESRGALSVSTDAGSTWTDAGAPSAATIAVGGDTIESATFVLVPGATLTPAAGKYLITATGQVEVPAAMTVTVRLEIDGAEAGSTTIERVNQTETAGDMLTYAAQHIATLTGANVVRVAAHGDTAAAFIANPITLTALRVS